MSQIEKVGVDDSGHDLHIIAGVKVVGNIALAGERALELVLLAAADRGIHEQQA